MVVSPNIQFYWLFGVPGISMFLRDRIHEDFRFVDPQGLSDWRQEEGLEEWLKMFGNIKSFDTWQCLVIGCERTE